ncbi:MAG: preprotein translocase subunit SecE [Cytophagaceae bacterium]|jgi:preprotein translocase subunit SecE|nr:preprotein translocase subunit SecE [Cytophagaceae bacterium]
MKRFISFVEGSIQELKDNVSWSSWSELQSSSLIVLVATVIIAALIAVIDMLFKYLIGNIY